jgi:hypothetical protein
MQLLENGKPFCPVLSIQNARRTDFVVQFGSIVPLSDNSVFYITTPNEPQAGLGVKHSIEFPAEKKLWSIQLNESFEVEGNFTSEVVFLEQIDL